MKRWHTALIILIILVALTQVVSVADPPDSDGFIPDIASLTPNAGVTPSYAQYPWTNYSFDIEKGKGIIDLNGALNIIPNLIFLPLILITKVSTYMLVSSYKVNIYNLMPDAINNIIWAIRNGVFDGFYELIIVFAGAFGIYRTYQGAKTTGIKVTLSTILVFGLSTWFFLNPSAFATGFNKAVETVSVKVLYEVTKVANPDASIQVRSEDDAVVLMANMFWDISVQKPYELVQYGKINKYDPKEFLAHEPGSEIRQNLANDYAKTNSYFRLAGMPGRVALALIMLLLGLVYNGCILLIAGAVAFNHFGSLFWICFAGVFFLAALYPSNGIKILGKWALQTFGHLIKRLIITVAISIYFAISMVIYGMTSTYGLLAVIVFNIVLLIYAILNHDKVFELLMGLFTANDGMVNRGMQKESLGGKIAKFAVSAYAGQKLYGNLRAGMERNKQKSFEKHNKDKAFDLLTSQYNQEKLQAKRNAENKLTEKYKKEKQEAEQRAKETGRLPEYSRFVLQAEHRKKQNLPMWTEKQIEESLEDSEFVKQVDFRKSKGYSPFSDEQIKSKVNSMYRLKKEGNDPNRLLYTDVEGKEEDQIKRDQKRKDFEIKNTQEQFEAEQKQNSEKIEDNIEAQVGPHFKGKVFVKSRTRQGIRAIGDNIKDAVGVENAEEIKLNSANRDTKIISLNEKIQEKVNTDTDAAAEEKLNIVENNTIETNKVIENVKTQNIKETVLTQENVSKQENKVINSTETIQSVEEKNNVVENHSVTNTKEINKITENIEDENIAETIKTIKTVELFNDNHELGSNSQSGISLGDVAMAAQLLNNKKNKRQNQEQAEAMKNIMDKLSRTADIDLDDNGSE